MRVDDSDSSSLGGCISLDGEDIVLKCSRCKGIVINCKNVEELGRKLKKLLDSSANFITCPKCDKTIWLDPPRELAPIDRSSLGSKRNSAATALLEIKDIRGMLLVSAINTIVGTVGLIYRSAWGFCLLVGVPMLVVSLMAYKDYKRERAERLGWIARIVTMTAYVLLALTAVGVLAITSALLPILAMTVLYLVIVNLVFIVPIFGQLWSPGKYGGYTSLPQPLVWLIRICLALIGLILLFVWVFLR